ncbi:hypothetical protein EON63_02085 [archaeon]|nr:MAG: hypothetical protein EON63_02085 [archaeon]
MRTDCQWLSATNADNIYGSEVIERVRKTGRVCAAWCVMYGLLCIMCGVWYVTNDEYTTYSPPSSPLPSQATLIPPQT